jgi:DNA-binding MarR family transcriptional regulator
LSEEDETKGAFDKIVADETVRSLSEQLNGSTLKSSTRIMILVLLTLARKMSAVQLRTLTGLGKGSLENHLNRLESSGYVRLSYEKSLGARGVSRQMVDVTEKGIDTCRALVKSMSSLAL